MLKRNEILEMLRQAGLEDTDFPFDEWEPVELIAFAQLVAAKEREAITDEYWSCIQSDLENGVKSLNEKAAKDFSTSMPELSKFGSWLEARNKE